MFAERLSDPPPAGPVPARTLWDRIGPGRKPHPDPGAAAAAGETPGPQGLKQTLPIYWGLKLLINELI